ncbi:MAG: hypothetical protein DDT40_00069 [candidate division WS2 bacterium]|nr:hypothetical protein [Candidatus Psychracetigena formicireducens]
MDCHINENLEKCSCSYNNCSRKGKCCECISYHWSKKQLPGCLFPAEAEKSYHRTLKYFLEIYGKEA